MRSIIQSIKNIISPSKTIAILDDCFPNLLTGFRIAEYNWYLENIPNVIIYSENVEFDTVYAEYVTRYPMHAHRIKKYNKSYLIDVHFVYLNFLNNAFYFLKDLHEFNIPFIMTLYPGGGFALNEVESDAKLAAVVGSPMLKAIITTQSVSKKYVEQTNCGVPLHDIYGGAINPLYFDCIDSCERDNRVKYGLNICFVADKYMPMGANKGYPEFIEAANMLIKSFPELRFSVVGRFDLQDYPVSEELAGSIVYMGLLFTKELREFFFTQDIIISPNRPFTLSPGNFDGFPTGCCIEASLCGVAVVCSDELNLNQHYLPNEEIVICPPNPLAVYHYVKNLINNPENLRKLANNGKKRSKEIFCPNFQIAQRAELIRKYSSR